MKAKRPAPSQAGLVVVLMLAASFAAQAEGAPVESSATDDRWSKADSAFGVEVSLGYPRRGGQMSNEDGPNGADCYRSLFFSGCFDYYYNEAYGVSYSSTPSLTVRTALWRYLWVGQSIERVGSSVSAVLDADDDGRGVGEPGYQVSRDLGSIEGWRISNALGLRWPFRARAKRPVVVYFGMTIDVDNIELVGSQPICVSARGCDEYRVEASAGNGRGFVMGSSVALTRSLLLSLDLAVHNKDWTFTYHPTGSGPDPLLDHEDHVVMVEDQWGLGLTYRY